MIRTPTVLTVLVSVLAIPGPARGEKAKVQVSLHPAVKTLAPGSSFDVGVQFKVAEGWHVYWKNPGDAGLPPRMTWKLPPGFEVGPLRFPVPHLHRAPGPLETNILEGEPVLVQTITAPGDIKPGTKVSLTADVRWLVCQSSCIVEHDSISIELPVGSPTGVPEPANQALLEGARRALPIGMGQSKHVKLAVSAPVKAVKPGQSFDVMLEVTVPPGTHIQSNTPATKGFIATRAFVEPDPGLDLGKVAYPPAQEHSHPVLGQVSEYRGKVELRVPVQVREDIEGASVRVAGVLTTQACDDKSSVCFPPEHVAWGLDLPVEGTAAAATAGPEGDENDSATGQVQTPSPSADAPTAGEPEAIPPPDESAESDPVRTAGPTEGAEKPAAAAQSSDFLQAFLERFGLPGLLVGCFLYGLLINATPCVLPVLSIKVLGFVQQAHESRGRTLILGLAFGAGVVLFFVILGFVAAAGRNVLQYPTAVIALGTIVMALALSMLGVYTLQAPAAAATLEGHIRQEGPLASFGKGALAPVLGFACTGPLLAGVFGWATQQPKEIAVVAFLFAGLGMASPYMLLGANPKWLSFLPKPGPWMVTFERIMGFLLLGMVAWLLYPLTAQIGADGFVWTLGFLVAVALACWVLGRVNVTMPAAQQWRYRLVAALIVLCTGGVIYGWAYPLGEAAGKPTYASNDDWSNGIPWRPWSLREAVRSGKTVFVDFTAAYCTVCKQNKAIATDTPEVHARMRELGVVALQGDFTTGDPEIHAMLKKFQRAGVPLNLIYPAGRPDDPIVLRTNLTKDYLLEKLAEAGPSDDAPATRLASR